MFLKPFRVKTQTSLKNSDRKKLRGDIVKQYPVLSEEDVLKLIPNKDDLIQTKICTHGDDNVLVYSVAKNPVFYDIFKQLYPTVYTLWEYPDLLPAFRTWAPVFLKLQKGADLMLPGVIPDREPSPKMFGNLQKGEMVSIHVAGNRAPVALGKALMSGEDMYMSALRGKGVGVLHIQGDALWEFGDKSQPPTIPEPLSTDAGEEEEEEEEGMNSTNDIENAMEQLEVEGTAAITQEESPTDTANHGGASLDTVSIGTEGNGEQAEEPADETDPIADMDELLHFCFACAIKARIKKSDLPLLTGNLLRNYMQPFSSGKQLDIKKSSFKKLSKFLQVKISEGYITVKQQTKGVDVITEIDKTHLGLRDLKVPDITEEDTTGKAEARAGEEDTYKPLTFTDVYCVNAVTHDLFKDAGLAKGDALVVSDVRQIVTSYIKSNNLQSDSDKKQVTLDPILAHMILKPAEGDLDHMNWEQVINRVMGKMQAGVAISSGDGPPVIRKGKMDLIKLDVAMRASQKKVTLVDNLEDYSIDVKVFSRLVQRSVACSCTVVPSEQKNKGPQVLIQGNQITFVAKLLTEKYMIPKRYITGLDNAPKQKKKR